MSLPKIMLRGDTAAIATLDLQYMLCGVLYGESHMISATDGPGQHTVGGSCACGALPVKMKDDGGYAEVEDPYQG